MIHLDLITEAVVNGNRNRVEELVRQGIDEKTDPRQILRALVQGMHDIGEKWIRLEAFVPDVMIAADVIKAGISLLTPFLQAGEDWAPLGKVVIGTVKGDIHDIGKNIVGTMLSITGFHVYDLGVDKPAIAFIEKAKEINADIIAASALLTTTMQGQKDLIELLTHTGEKNRFMVMVGGGPVTQEWANSIGADGYGETAAHAVQTARDLMKRKRAL